MGNIFLPRVVTPYERDLGVAPGRDTVSLTPLEEGLLHTIIPLSTVAPEHHSFFE